MASLLLDSILLCPGGGSFLSLWVELLLLLSVVCVGTGVLSPS